VPFPEREVEQRLSADLEVEGIPTLGNSPSLALLPLFFSG
jgi:hypothetical protein